MTKLEETLLLFDDFFKRISLDYFIHGSTLLGIVRNRVILDRAFGDEVCGHLIPSTISTDKEHNFGCLAEDLTEEKIDIMKKEFPFFESEDHHFQNSLNWFGHKLWDSNETSLGKWSLDGGFGMIAKFHKTKTMRIEDMGNDRFKWWPKKLLDKKKWGEVSILGRTFKTPSNPAIWFNQYYGKDWMTEKIYWSWMSDAKNIISLEQLKAKREL
jgi:hypothetical protein